MFFTKSQLLTKYDIPFEAFEILEGSGHFKSPFISREGLSVVSPTKDDEFALESARLAVSGFRGALLLPYHRFLLLRFLCLPLKDVYQELLNIGLLASAARFKISFVEKIHAKVLARAPEEMKKVFKERKPPKSKIGKARFETFLSIMNIKFFYENPAKVDDLGYFLKARDVTELLLTTAGSNEEIAKFFSDNLKTKVPQEAILAYRLLFYATHELKEDSWKNYLATIPPDERKAKLSARGKSLVEYSIMKGLQGLASIAEILDRMKMDSLKEFGNSSGFQTPAAYQARRSALDNVLKIDQYQRKIGGSQSTDIWKLFESFTVRESDIEKPKTLDELRKTSQTKESAG